MDTSSEVDSKISTALLGAVTTAALDAALAGKADASALAALRKTGPSSRAPSPQGFSRPDSHH